MKTPTPNQLPPEVNFDVNTDSGFLSTLFRANQLTTAMRICADWLDTQPNAFIASLTTYWDGDAHRWAIRVIYSGGNAPDDGDN
jgi:hypothetical protein